MIFDYLDHNNVDYIVPVKESAKLRTIKEMTFKDPKARVQTHQMKGKYLKGKRYSHMKFKIAFYRKKGIDFGKFRTQYRNETRSKKDILADIFVLATNRMIHSPSIKKKYTFYITRSDYGDRW